MRSTIWKKTLICLGAVLFLESPAVSTAFAYTVKAENTDAEAATSNIKSILLIGQDKREGRVPSAFRFHDSCHIGQGSGYCKPDLFYERSLCCHSWIFDHSY